MVHVSAQRRGHGSIWAGDPEQNQAPTMKGQRVPEQMSPEHAPGRKWPAEPPRVLLSFLTMAFIRREKAEGWIHQAHGLTS